MSKNKPQLDTELIRLQGLLHLFDEIADRVYKLKKDCGEDAKNRCIEYLKSRKGWVLDILNH